MPEDPASPLVSYPKHVYAPNTEGWCLTCGWGFQFGNHFPARREFGALEVFMMAMAFAVMAIGAFKGGFDFEIRFIFVIVGCLMFIQAIPEKTYYPE